MPLRISYAVTFEFDVNPPLTHRGTVEAGQVATCARMAIQEAQKALRPIRWSSMVFVALERTLVGSTTAEVDTDETAEATFTRGVTGSAEPAGDAAAAAGAEVTAALTSPRDRQTR